MARCGQTAGALIFVVEVNLFSNNTPPWKALKLKTPGPCGPSLCNFKTLVIILQFTCCQWLLLPGFLGGELLFYRNVIQCFRALAVTLFFFFCFSRSFCTPAKVAAWASGLLIKGIVFQAKSILTSNNYFEFGWWLFCHCILVLWYDTWDGLIHSHGRFLLIYCKRRQQ